MRSSMIDDKVTFPLDALYPFVIVLF